MDDAKDLARYNQKRDFSKTAEPAGKLAKAKGFHYLIQKHAATRLHYDFRLELDGVLKSWAVTRGPSLDPHDKRLAVEVEDHPVSYGSFEGTIPKGQYGGGTVMLWDQGTWEPIGDPHEGLEQGDLKFILHGERLGGSWALVRMKGRPQDHGRNNWLLIKHDDEAAREGDGEAWLDTQATSIVSDRTMDEITANPGHMWTLGKSNTVRQSDKPAPAPKKKAVKSARPDLLRLSFVAPELATLADTVPQGEQWVHEVKFDGYRVMALVEQGHVRILTRTGLDWTHKFQGLADLLAALPVGSAMLDGEVVALNAEGASSFKTLQDDLSEGRQNNLQYYVFDLLHHDGDDLTGLPLLARKTRLEGLLKGHEFQGRINYSDHFGHDGSFLPHVCGMGLEGIISKRADARYRSGRNRHWLKIKCHKRQEFVIGGFTEPTHAGRGIGALLLGYFEDEKLVYAGKVGTGFSHDTSLSLRRKLDDLVRKTPLFDTVPRDARPKAVWVDPSLVCEVEFSEWTPDGRLRHPSFQGLRDDKPARAVGRDVAVAAPNTGDEEVDTMPAETGAPAKSKTSTLKTSNAKPKGVEVGGITISHPDRVIFPDSHITKQALADYYLSVADHILPHIVGRPISMVRCPEGIGEACFFQRHIAREQSPYLFDTGIAVKGRHEDYLMIKNERGLLTLVQWGVIEIHPWGCMADRPELPDRIVFDLDPDPEVPWQRVIEGAAEVRQRMKELGLTSFLKTTGGKGLHVTVPLQRKYGWPAIKAFAHAIAESMEHDSPDRYIAKASKAARKGRIFVDYLRNDVTSTAIAPFAVRARPGATVATPLAWDELTVELKPAAFDITTVPRRLGKQRRDPWADFAKVHQTIDAEHLRALKISPE